MFTSPGCFGFFFKKKHRMMENVSTKLIKLHSVQMGCIIPMASHSSYVSPLAGFLLCFFFTLCCPKGNCFPMGHSGRARNPILINYEVHTGSFRVSVIHLYSDMDYRIFNVRT